MKKFMRIGRPDPDNGYYEEYLMDQPGVRIRKLEYPDRIIAQDIYYTPEETNERTCIGLIIGALLSYIVIGVLVYL